MGKHFEIYIPFTVPGENEVTRINKNRKEVVNKLSKVSHRIKCKYVHDDKKWETCEFS